MGEAGDVLSCVMAGGEGVVEERPGGAVLRVKNDTGEGSMAFCQVFDGVGLSFNDFRLDAYDSGFVVGPDMLCIDHCREGRIEQPVAGGAYSYVASGDLKIDDRSRHTGMFVLPLGHYRGITVSFDLARAERSLQTLLMGGQTCVGVFSMVVRQLRMLAHLALAQRAENGAAVEKALKLHPYAARRAAAQARALDAEALLALYRQSVTADAEIKSGKLRDREALQLFMLKIVEMRGKSGTSRGR